MMICEMITDQPLIPPNAFLDAYAHGAFPMADRADSNRLYWLSPDPRCVVPLDGIHLPRRLRKTVRNAGFEVTVDKAFGQVLERCAGGNEDRPESWINPPIRAGFTALHDLGHAHSVEVWRDGQLAGGLYGLAIRGVFFGESMFAAERDASKVAFVHMIALLRAGGYRLLDSQMLTPHLAQFGAVEIRKAEFLRRLGEALRHQAAFGEGDVGRELEGLIGPKDPAAQGAASHPEVRA